MVFSSWLYILFLILTVVLYWTLPARFRVPLLLVASYIFYMSWSPPYGLIYGPVIFFDSLYFYWLSLAMVKWPRWKKHILVTGIVSELCLLGYFKYANFLSGTLDAVLTALDMPAPQVRFDIFLPLAISFTNFILISYLVDVYRGDEKPDPSFTRFATYVAFFPHLIAGPIVRASELLRQFDTNPAFDVNRLVRGIHRFALGFFIKVFVADQIANYVDLVYGNTDYMGFNTAWLATYGFAIQIFCDFSGYTLMAQGSALMMGYTLPENFNAPYFAANISDFWRRWHISLSRWLRDYLYIPLGGSRGGRLMTYRNLFLTMGLGGLWHGASWNFVLWGLYHGLLLSLHKFGDYFKLNQWIAKPLAILITFHAVCIGWVLFRCQTFADATRMLAVMANPLTSLTLPETVTDVVETGRYAITTDMALVMILLFFGGHALWRRYGRLLTAPRIQEWAVATAYAMLLYCLVTLGGNRSEQFIYFQF